MTSHPGQTLESALRTVRHLRIYFAELLEQAAQIASTATAVDRGYFSASEDDQVTALVASYAQSRSAALDLIHELRHNQPRDDPQRSIFFLLGFSTALILVDVARFLRDNTEGRPVVRRKLNQPVPAFGIPGGTYDTVQRSLLGARNAWRLHQARSWYEHERDHLVSIAREHDVEDLIETIETLLDGIDTSKRRFVRERLQTRGDQTLRRVGRSLFQRSVYGIQKLTSSMMADVYVKPGHEPSVPEEIFDGVKPILLPGDVLVVRKEYALTNYFLPGYWPHAALHLGTPEQLTAIDIPCSPNGTPRWDAILSAAAAKGHCILEAKKDGVHLRCLGSPLASDSFVILRPQMTLDRIGKGICRVLGHEGKGYDFDFNFGRSDRLVCTEVVYRAFEGDGGVPFELQHRAGRPTLAGADLVEMAVERRGFDAVAAFIPSRTDDLLIDDEAHAAIRETLASNGS